MYAFQNQYNLYSQSLFNTIFIIVVKPKDVFDMT